MQITTTIDRDEVAAELEASGVEIFAVEGGDYYVQSTVTLSELIDAVIKATNFTFDRENVELAAVLQFPELTR